SSFLSPSSSLLLERSCCFGAPSSEGFSSCCSAHSRPYRLPPVTLSSLPSPFRLQAYPLEKTALLGPCGSPTGLWKAAGQPSFPERFLAFFTQIRPVGWASSVWSQRWSSA